MITHRLLPGLDGMAFMFAAAVWISIILNLMRYKSEIGFGMIIKRLKIIKAWR